MAQKLAPPPVPDPLAPGTFRSLLPTLDDLLTIIRSQSTSANPPSPVEASEAVAAKARELDTSLESMRTAALNLPGGHLSTARLQELSEMLEDEAENRRTVLRSFARSEMNVVDGLLAGRGGAGLGEESGVPTPAQGLAGLADTEGV